MEETTAQRRALIGVGEGRTCRTPLLSGGDNQMDAGCRMLIESGYDIIAVFGPYCRAQRDQQDILLRWDGEGWVIL